jgi:hypothetical protein
MVPVGNALGVLSKNLHVQGILLGRGISACLQSWQGMKRYEFISNQGVGLSGAFGAFTEASSTGEL